MNTDLKNEHKVTLISRERLEMTGIGEVESYTDSAVTAVSSMGGLTVEGEDIRIESFSSDTGKLLIRGKIDGVFYFGNDAGKRSLFPRLRRK